MIMILLHDVDCDFNWQALGTTTMTEYNFLNILWLQYDINDKNNRLAFIIGGKEGPKYTACTHMKVDGV